VGDVRSDSVEKDCCCGRIQQVTVYSCPGKLGEHMRPAGVYQVQLALSAGEDERR
jgi:hypothetical protein